MTDNDERKQKPVALASRDSERSNRGCPSDTGLLRIVFQSKWRLRVLQEIVRGPVRLSRLRHEIPECTKKVLIDTVHGLEKLGWIERQEYVSKSKRVEYSLTAKCEEEVRRAISIASNEADPKRKIAL